MSYLSYFSTVVRFLINYNIEKRIKRSVRHTPYAQKHLYLQ
ncbi:hypothetical protein HMPREF9442_00093 [Paraprevotella xylaniphila YIT 11841]|uniref:Uncharacterized protein n=1 Tax=Paraprevotella xylaniphila YIT 11841 TaxID=762982 RepID=F3QPK6_9BACT|nr:hypothetical protein HMPREF9442_00093 [Paraprevotella xylaniphila YIT 11841]